MSGMELDFNRIREEDALMYGENAAVKSWGWKRVRCVTNQNSMKGFQMKLSEYKSYDELPLFLNAAMMAKVLGVSPSSSYELMHIAQSHVGYGT